MSAPLRPRILKFFADHPDGASVERLAEYLGSDSDSTIRSLRSMEGRGEAVMIRDSALLPRTVWSQAKTTPPIFRAVETLEAMQSAARCA
ncbi:hypothetical protein [Paraburkholderia antibiotica]|uniref:ArsR family transcriptional regulator n=1 Tax=Paraburkholderia antibiotica TaxID=2728839 RepID=A0A7Y0A1R8_9BURK|nr:hypothetical protein [Paraburkholderia antibiotica]NML34916.1 hypothetical protein [Paraburkholderia antibiotica]